MIVDVHTHVSSFRKPVSEEEATYVHWRPHHPVRVPVSWEEHYNAMSDVDKAIVFGIAHGKDVPNDFIAEYARLHPDKIIGFMSVDTNQEDAVEEIERAYTELGLKGIKLGPAYQNFHPFSDKACAVYQKAQDLGLPILFHMGTTPGRWDSLEYTHPRLLEKVAVAFPDLKIVIAHMGHPWFEDTIVLIRKQPNVYADISALFYRPWQFYNALVLCNEYDQMHKLLFGSDFPVTTPKETIDNLRRINRFAEGTNLPIVPEEKIEEIINRDSLKILGIT